MIKNVSYTITYAAWDKTDGTAVTGDVGNHTCKISMDGASLSSCANIPSEIGSGIYRIVLTASETSCNTLTLVVTSSTAGVIIPPIQLAFEEAVDLTAMSENITAIQDHMPEAGTVSTLTAADVWTYTSNVISETEPWGRLYYLWMDLCKNFNASPVLIQKIWSAEARTLTSNAATPQEIWSYADRTLTDSFPSVPTVSDIQSGLAKAVDLQGLAKTSDLSDLAKTSDLSSFATASALSTVDTVVDAIKAKTDNLPAVPAARSDVQIAVPTVSEIQSGLAKAVDLQGLAKTVDLSDLAKTSDLSSFATASALATVDTVVDAIKAKTDNLPAVPAAKSDVQITVNADGIDVPTAAQNASAVWAASSRTLTSSTDNGGATAQEIWSYNSRTLTSTQSMDIAAVQETLNAIFALLGCWNVSENALTTYDKNGSVLHTYTLTRDAEGNITGVEG